MATGFLDLPTELILLILPYCDEEALIALVSTNGLLNAVAAEFYLAEYGFPVPPRDGTLKIRHRSSHGIHLTRLLSIAFSIRSMKALHFCFSFPGSWMMLDVRHLTAFISRLDSLEEAYFDIFPFEPSGDSDDDETDFEAVRVGDGKVGRCEWAQVVLTLFEAVRDKGVREARISQRVGFEEKELSRRLFKEGYPLGYDAANESAVTPLVDSLKRGSDALIQSFGRMTDVARRVIKSESNSRPDEASAQEIWHPGQLEGLHFDCPLFLRPPLTAWATHFIQSAHSTLTTLSLAGHDLPPRVWRPILGAFNLPVLTKFVLRSSDSFWVQDGPAAKDLIAFFRRHPLVTNLDLRGAQPLDEASTFIPDPPLLPLLTNLAAHGLYVALIAKGHAHAEETSEFESQLKAVVLVGEEYGFGHTLWRHQDLHFSEGLQYLNCLIQSRPLMLTISLPRSAHPESWFQDHVQAGGYVADSTLPQQVRKLVIDCNYRRHFSDDFFLVTFPRFCNLLKGLRKVEFQRTRVGWGESSTDIQTVETRFVALCPQIERFSID